MTREEKIQRFFACRPKLDKAYMTSDGTIFIKWNNARLHAKSLVIHKVVKILNHSK